MWGIGHVDKSKSVGGGKGLCINISNNNNNDLTSKWDEVS